MSEISKNQSITEVLRTSLNNQLEAFLALYKNKGKNPSSANKVKNMSRVMI